MDIVVESEPNLKRPHDEEEEEEERGEGGASPAKVARMDEEEVAAPAPSLVIDTAQRRMEKLVAGLEDELWCPLCAAVLYG